MDGTMVGIEELLNDVEMPVDGDKLLLIGELLEWTEGLFVGISLVYIEGILEALYKIELLLMVVGKGEEGLG